MKIKGWVIMSLMIPCLAFGGHPKIIRDTITGYACNVPLTNQISELMRVSERNVQDKCDHLTSLLRMKVRIEGEECKVVEVVSWFRCNV